MASGFWKSKARRKGFALSGNHADDRNPMDAVSHTKLACIVHLADLSMVKLEVGIRKNAGLNQSVSESADYLRLDEPALQDLLDAIRASLKK
jgi:hypothetical protein